MKNRYLYLLLLALIALTSCDTTEPTDEINYHNKILFTSNRSGRAQLYMINPDGTNIKQITSGQYSHSDGRWSPGAKQIIAQTNKNKNTAYYTQMVIMNSDGTNRNLLRPGMQMSWSPDGEKIVFMLWPSTERHNLTTYICRMNKDGTNVIKLTKKKRVWNGTPDWSPDGKLIAFASGRDYSFPSPYSEIYLMNADGSNQRRLTFTDSLLNTNPSWSPDGRKIAFSCNGLISLMNSDGSDIKILDSLSTGGHISWSPDGNYLAFGAGQIYIIKLDGSEIKKILTDDAIWTVDWSK